MSRMVFVRLADPSHRMPHPSNPQIDFPAEGMAVEAEHPVWMQLIADGSLTGAEPETQTPGLKPKKEKD